MKAHAPARIGKAVVIIVVFCMSSLMLGVSPGDTKPRSNEDFSFFWQVFRKAALKEDWQMLTQMCNFPVTVKGVLDRDPVYRVGRRDFPRVFHQFLREGVFSPNEEFEFIRKTTTLADDGRPARRVGDMIFRRTDRGWLLDTFYMEYTSE
jgi:hypothetical protein